MQKCKKKNIYYSFTHYSDILKNGSVEVYGASEYKCSQYFYCHYEFNIDNKLIILHCLCVCDAIGFLGVSACTSDIIWILTRRKAVDLATHCVAQQFLHCLHGTTMNPINSGQLHDRQNVSATQRCPIFRGTDVRNDVTLSRFSTW